MRYNVGKTSTAFHSLLILIKLRLSKNNILTENVNFK